MKKLLLTIIFGTSLIASLPLAAEQAATTIRDTTLVEKPFRDASPLTEIATDTQLVVLGRKGGWYEVRVENQSGWVRLTSLRLQEESQKQSSQGKSSGNPLDALGDAISGGLFTTGKSSDVASTTGIKGLTKEDIENADPDPGAVAKLDNYKVSKEQAERFAKQGKLRRSKLDYLAGFKAGKTASLQPEGEDAL